MLNLKDRSVNNQYIVHNDRVLPIEIHWYIIGKHMLREQHEETYVQDMVMYGEYQFVSVANKIFDQKMLDNMNRNLI